MNKFEIIDANLIKHNFEPKMIIQVIFNDEDNYNVLQDIYELFYFRGNKIVVKWYNDNADELDDYSHIRSILRRAWAFYRSKIYIEKKEYIAGAMEDERYILQHSQKQNYWVLTDKEYGIVCIFEHKNFNENQQYTILEDLPMPDVKELARVTREMGDWLGENHYDKIF